MASDKSVPNISEGSAGVEENMDSFEAVTYFIAGLGVVVLSLCVVVAAILIYQFCRSVTVTCLTCLTSHGLEFILGVSFPPPQLLSNITTFVPGGTSGATTSRWRLKRPGWSPGLTLE